VTAVADIDRKAAIRFIICLGIVSMFADMTYEGAHSVIGPLLSDLGSSALQVGFVAGVGEMFAASLRLFSGRLADKTRAYWTIAIFGYAINIVVVPALAFALAMFYLPESPRWLLIHGREDEAESIVDDIEQRVSAERGKLDDVPEDKAITIRQRHAIPLTEMLR